MSHALARCRRLLGDPLLIRVGTTLEPTQRGLSLLEPLEQILRKVNHDVLARPLFDPATSTRRFRIAATSSTALVLIPPLLAILEKEAPGVSVSLLPALNSGDDLLHLPEVDVLVAADRVPSTLPRERLYVDRWVVASAPGNLATRNGVTLDTLAMVPHIVFEGEGGARVSAYTVLSDLGIHNEVRLRSHDFGSLPVMVASTGYIAIIQERLGELFARAGLVTTFLLPVKVPDLGLDLIVNPRFARDPARPWLRSQLFRSVARSLDHPRS